MVKPHTCKCKECGAIDFLLPGWLCECGAFNGEAKDELVTCRYCGAAKKKPKLTELERLQRNSRISALHVNEGLTPKQLAVRFGISRSQASRIARGVVDTRMSHQKKRGG